MKLDSMDIYNCSTLTFQLLKGMIDSANNLKKEAERIEEVNRMLVHRIQEGKITDVDTIMCALSWLTHSDLEPQEILEKCGV